MPMHPLAMLMHRDALLMRPLQYECVGRIVNACPCNANASGYIVNAFLCNANASAALLMRALAMPMRQDAF